MNKLNKRTVCAAALMALYTGPAFARQNSDLTMVIPLHFVEASQVAQQVREGLPEAGRRGKAAPSANVLPAGITGLDVDASTNALIVTGSPDAVGAARRMVRGLDVQPTQIRLAMRVIRSVFDGAGHWTIETIGAPTVLTLNRRPAKFAVDSGRDGYTLDINPQVNDDGTLLLTANMSAALSGATKAQTMRTVQEGATVVLIGVTNSSNKAIRLAVGQGRLSVGGKEKHTDLYLQITATIVKPNAAPEKPAEPPVQPEAFSAQIGVSR